MYMCVCLGERERVLPSLGRGRIKVCGGGSVLLKPCSAAGLEAEEAEAEEEAAGCGPPPLYVAPPTRGAGAGAVRTFMGGQVVPLCVVGVGAVSQGNAEQGKCVCATGTEERKKREFQKWSGHIATIWCFFGGPLLFKSDFT